jgi:hypothetical protein
VWFCCTGCSKSNCMKIILRSQEDRGLFTADQQQRVTVRRWGSYWNLLSTMFNVYWVEICVSMECEHNLDKAILQHLVLKFSDFFDLYISSHAVSTFCQFHYMKNTTTTSTIPHPRRPVHKLSVCSVPHHSDCVPLNSKVPNSALWVPPPQKCVLITRYVEARNINTDCNCRH